MTIHTVTATTRILEVAGTFTPQYRYNGIAWAYYWFTQADELVVREYPSIDRALGYLHFLINRGL